MAENEGVTEDLKRQSQRVWIRAMNNITCCAEEIIKSELINTNRFTVPANALVRGKGIPATLPGIPLFYAVHSSSKIW
jgi:hypothetical protein